MDKNIGSIALKVVAVVCVYLIASISTASAIEISIYRQIMVGGTPQPSGSPVTTTLDYDDVINKTFSFVFDPADTRYENVQVKISVMGKDPSYSIKKIYLFKCKESLPLDCVDYEPVEAADSLSGAKGTFYWRDVARNAEANFLTIVKFGLEGSETDSWVGYWDAAERTSVQDFRHDTYDVSTLDVYANPGMSPEWIKEFMDRHRMVPMNWVDSVKFGPVGGSPVTQMYILQSNKTEMETAVFKKFLPDGNTISSLSKDYMLSFAKGSIANPVTLFSNVAPPCDDGYCDIGEDTSLCCLDCGCSLESQDCTATESYPNGLCHTCGDGITDPVENWTNCCADAGCSAKGDNSYCDTSENAAGFCRTPTCPDGTCEPTEDSDNCAPDCYATPGKTCSDVFGDGWYYKSQKCVEASCGNNDCEAAGGETYQTCCADCNSCPSGQYCDKSVLSDGVCTTPGCGQKGCESGETAANCCTDCGCTGSLECESNVCHLCGNGIYEKPVETEDNCCRDAGCSAKGEYCTIENDCRPAADIGFTVSMLPSELDCQSAGASAEVRFTPVNGPYHMVSYQRVAYVYNGSMYTLSGCRVDGGIYTCPLPTTGSDTFRGCYGGTGDKPVSFIVSLKYFEDIQGKASNDEKAADITLPFTVKVKRAKSWSCTENSVCAESDGETSSSCCYDCGCEGSGICTISDCTAEGNIRLYAASVPAKSDIDCANGISAKAQFSMNLENMPRSSEDPFKIVSLSLEYDGKNYTSKDMPGFTCVAAKEGNRETGIIDCEMPVAYFPACDEIDETATMYLNVGIVGGGLSGKYQAYRGMLVRSDPITFTYIPGLPKCGDGKKDPNLGETEDNCCRDMGCSVSGETCTSDGSCRPLADIGLTVAADTTVDCVLETEDEIQNAVFKVELSMKEGIEPFTRGSGVALDDVYVDGLRIEDLGGRCVPETEAVTGWVCTIPISRFAPYCFEGGAHGTVPDHEKMFDPIKLKAKLSWQASDGKIKIEAIENVSFFVSARTPECNELNKCEENLGEAIDKCCWDCGCSGGNICTRDRFDECVPKNEITLTATPAPASLNCKSVSAEDKLSIGLTITNHPYEIRYVKWQIYYRENGDSGDWVVLNPAHQDCYEEVDYYEKSTGNYVCDIPLAYFPPCARGDGEGSANLKRDLNVTARMLQGNSGKSVRIEPSDEFSVTVTEPGTPLCGSGYCDAGETKGNCCKDCGCDAGQGDVCTDSGRCWKACGDDTTTCNFELEIKTKNVPVSTCQMTAGTIADYKITDYGCVFQDPVEVDVGISHMPANAVVRSISYRWTWTGIDNQEHSEVYKDAYPEPKAGGWKIGFMLNSDGSYKVKGEATKDTVISDLTMTLESNTPGTGETKVFKVKADEDIKLRVKSVKNDNLLDYEATLQKISDAMEKANKAACTMVSVIATCVICSLMAGLDKKPTVDKDKVVKDAKTPDAGAETIKKGGAFGGMQPGIFTQLMNTVADGKRGVSLAVGLAAGAGFALIGSTMLDCNGGYYAALGSAVAICGGILYSGNPATLQSITRVCDMITTAMQLLKTVMGIQQSTLSYQTCLISAEAELARAQTTQDSYETATRTANYYSKIAACHQQSATSMTSITNDLTQATTGMTQYIGGSRAGIDLEPDHGTLGPGGSTSLIINYNFGSTSSSTAKDYGTVTIQASYKYTKNDGSIYTASSRATSARLSRIGAVTCSVDNSGIDCIDTAASTIGKITSECSSCGTLSGGTIIVTYKVGNEIDSQQYAFVPSGGTVITSTAPGCSDSAKNGNETDVDCGGTCSVKCANGKTCGKDADCQSGTCLNSVCSVVV